MKQRFTTSLVLLFLSLFLSNISLAQSSWSPWETLYTDSDVTVQIQFKSFTCAQQRKTKFRYNVMGSLSSSSKTVYWKLQYKDCNNQLQEMNNQLPIGGQGATTGSVESTSYMFMGEITKKFSDVSLTPPNNSTAVTTTTSTWGAWETLYSDQDVTVDIQFKLASNSCINGGKRSKYRYRISGRPVSYSKFVYWKLSYNNCNNNLIAENKKIQIGGSNVSTGMVESMDYTFTGTVSQKFSNVYAYPTKGPSNTTTTSPTYNQNKPKWKRGQNLKVYHYGSAIKNVVYYSYDSYLTLEVGLNNVKSNERVTLKAYYSTDGGMTYPNKISDQKVDVKGGKTYKLNWFDVDDYYNRYGDQLAIKVIATTAESKKTTYLSYVGDINAPMGVQFGRLGGLGFYMGARTTLNSFKRVDYTANSTSGITNYAGTWVIGNKQKTQRFVISAGVTAGITDNIHIYYGMGYSRTRTLWNFHPMAGNSQMAEEWAVVEDSQVSGLEYETGLLISTKHFLFNIGVSSDSKLETYRPTFGLGMMYNNTGDGSFIMNISSTLQAPLGLMIGGTGDSGLGMYFAGRRSLKSKPDYYGDNTGLYSYDILDNKEYEYKGQWTSDEEDKTYRYSVTTGLLLQMNKYFFLYSGLGLGGRKTLQKYNYTQYGDEESGWAMDESNEIKYGFELEGGLFFAIPTGGDTKILLNGGVTTLNFDSPEVVVGLGLGVF